MKTSIQPGLAHSLYHPFVAIVASLFAVLPPVSATKVVDGNVVWNVSVSGGIATIDDVNPVSGAIVTELAIPSAIGGGTVQYLGSGSFSAMTDLESVTFPSSLRGIKSSAFSGCTALRSVRVNEGLEYTHYRRNL